MRADPLDVQAEKETWFESQHVMHRGGETYDLLPDGLTWRVRREPFVHPRLGVAELRRATPWKSDAAPEPAPTLMGRLVAVVLAFIAGVAVGWVVWG